MVHDLYEIAFRKLPTASKAEWSRERDDFTHIDFPIFSVYRKELSNDSHSTTISKNLLKIWVDIVWFKKWLGY